LSLIGSLQPIESGTITSEHGFPIPLQAEVIHGADYVRAEASPTHMRINVKAVLKSKDGSLISYSYKGLIEVNDEFLAIYSGSPDAETTSYGNSLTHIIFETGSESLKELEHSLFIGSAHFVVEENGKFLIETKISRVKG
jgi:hypothetical protein